jgi:hypothetical protein
MRDILKKAFTNVKIRDHENKIILDQSNLFVQLGRELIRDVLAGAVAIDNTKYVVEVGSSTQVPAEGDTDLIAPFLDPNQVYTNSYIINVVGNTEIDFVFTYTNGTGGLVTFSELGLFYRPLGPDPDVTPDDRVNKGVLLARLKTTYTSISVGAGKQITITWKIIF